MRREAGEPSILDVWGITDQYLTGVINDNPSLRGMIVGYIAEAKLRELFESIRGVTDLRKDDDHDRTRKGDLVVTYRASEFIIEAKSLQTNHTEILAENGEWVRRMQKSKGRLGVSAGPRYRYIANPAFEEFPDDYRLSAEYRGGVQCDASDRRTVQLSNGACIETTCLKVGEFDILAAGLFGFRGRWDFGFALNRDLPRSRHKNYPDHVRAQLLKSLVPVKWPLTAPFVSDPLILMDRLVAMKSRR